MHCRAVNIHTTGIPNHAVKRVAGCVTGATGDTGMVVCCRIALAACYAGNHALLEVDNRFIQFLIRIYNTIELESNKTFK